MSWLLACVLLLGACTVVPEEELPEGVEDPKQDLVAHILDNPSDLDAHADLLRLQVRDGDAEGARTTVGHALKHNGTDFRSHLLAAQYHRWQVDLINAEKSLLTARDLAPRRLEPRVALGSLYHQTYLETDELEQRRLAVELADPALRPEFSLDLAYAAALQGKDEQAEALAKPLSEDAANNAAVRSRAWLLLCETALRRGDEAAAADACRKAFELRPTETGLVQYAARLCTVVSAEVNGQTLQPVFDKVLETQDVAESRWAALYGKWISTVTTALAKGTDAFADDNEILWRRVDAIAPDHPDTLTRRYQALALVPERKEEFEAAGAKLDTGGFGKPAAARSAGAVLRLWRAEDALRLNAFSICLAEVDQLLVREPELPNLRVLRALALFKARNDAACLEAIQAMAAESETPDEMLLSVRWWVLLRQGRSKDVLDELANAPGEPTNARLWVEAVATFHLYRGAANSGE